MQKTIVETDTKMPQVKNELTISATDKKKLNKHQVSFNTLVKEIEFLRADRLKITKALDKKMKYYSTNILPLEQKIVSQRSSFVKLITPFYKGKNKISKANKRVLAELINEFLDDIFKLSGNEPNEELKAIYEEVNGVSFEKLKEESFEEMKSEMEAMAGFMGIDIDLEGFHGKMTEEEMMEKIFAMKHEFERKQQEKQHKQDEKQTERKKSKKQIAEEEREKQKEEARNKNIGSIYKQLVKIFHPDLEADPREKIKKEEIMKQLTVAYEKNDLHTLLKLELEWIQKESNDTSKLSDEKLAIYNEVLREQILKLYAEIQELYYHPQYECLHRFVSYPTKLKSLKLEQEKKRLEKTAEALADWERGFTGNDPLNFVQRIIQIYKQELSRREPEDDWEDMFEFYG